MNIPEDLIHAARTGNLNILAGSGVSVDAGLPGWAIVLRELGECLPDKTKLRPIEVLIKQGRMLDAAELIRADVSIGRICERLKRLLLQPGQSAPIADAIWALRPKFVMTTNYDAILETALARAHGIAATVLIPSVNVPPILGGIEASVAKIHGDLSAPESIVLSRTDYFQTMLSITNGFGGIWSEFIRRPTLAIGYSLHDPDLQLLLHMIEDKLRGFSHSLFLVTPKLPEEDLRLITLLPGVIVCEYNAEYGHRPPIINLLGQLANERALANEHIPSTLEIRGAMLGHFNRQVSAFLHDIRQPLMAAGIWIKTLERTENHDEIKSGIGEISGELKRIELKLKTIEELVIAGEGHLIPSSWSSIRETIEFDISKSPDDNLSLNINQIEDDTEVPIGKRLFSVLARILIDNAIEASQLLEHKVLVDISVKGVDGSKILVTRVQDRGHGISPNIKNQLFQPGTSSKGEQRGHGLYLLRALCEEIGGGVEILSTPNKGTSASFWLPVKLRQEEAPNPALDKDQKFLKRLDGLNIIFVDDNIEFLGIFSKILEDSGAIVHAYSSSEIALNTVLSNDKCPDCILTDLVMPQISGLDLLRALRERWPGIPAVILSGYTYTTAKLGFDEHTIYVEKGVGGLNPVIDALRSAIAGGGM